MLEGKPDSADPVRGSNSNEERSLLHRQWGIKATILFGKMQAERAHGPTAPLPFALNYCGTREPVPKMDLATLSLFLPTCFALNMAPGPKKLLSVSNFPL